MPGPGSVFARSAAVFRRECSEGATRMAKETFLDGLALLPVAEAVVLAFCFAFGAGIGSFLNVVVHRGPRGESLVFGGSHCPRCGAAIRSRDNVPVLGWVLLRGRCRDCAEPIAVRYPVVEAVAGVLVTAVAGSELLTQTPRGRSGIDGLLAGDSWGRALVCVHHCWIALTLLAWVLLAWDGHRPGWRWQLLTLVGTAVPTLVWPDVGWQPAVATVIALVLLRGIEYCTRRP